MVRFARFGVLISLALASAPAALAQGAPPQVAPPQGAAQRSPSDQLAQLHDDLHLSDDQEAPWRVYADLVARSADMQARHQATQMLLPQLPTPRRLALVEATMTQDLADFRRQSQAIAALYDRLTPAQQRIFDRDTLPQNAEAGGPAEDSTPPDQRLRMPPGMN